MIPNTVQSVFDREGYALLDQVLSPSDCDRLTDEIESVYRTDEKGRGNGLIESGQGRVVGGRNLIDRWQGWRWLLELPATQDFVAAACGPNAGLVRILYFDKPPGSGWALAMHRDKTISVAEHQSPPAPFGKPTKKAGVSHVEATDRLLLRMVTLRFHLDAMHDENGPLTVIPTSHVVDVSTNDPVVICCRRGDVFAMRPLLVHGSLASKPDTTDHRRVLHLEFAPEATLPARYQWHRFETLQP